PPMTLVAPVSPPPLIPPSNSFAPAAAPLPPTVPVTPAVFEPPSVQGSPQIPPLPPMPGGVPAAPSGLAPLPPPASIAPTAPKLTPMPAAADGATVSYLNVPRVAVDYEVTKKGPSGLGKVELWLKDANGWSRVSTANAGDPLQTDLPADGAYGTKVVPVSGQGVRGAEPDANTEPDLWVVRDTAPPNVWLQVHYAPWDGDKPPPALFTIQL